MSRQKLPSWTLPVWWACLVVWAVAMALALAECSRPGPTVETTYPESAEFSELESGQKRWSWHRVESPDLRKWYVVVDHETGAQYLYAASTGLCPLLDADGTPLLVAEAGE